MASLRKAIDDHCRIEDCGLPARSRSGLCNAHYIRWRRTGDPNSPRKRRKRGLGTMSSNGYRKLSRQYEHIVVAEKALGRPLPPGAEVHHANENKTDNRGSNLVICPNHAYHALLHRRTRALDACGHADWIKCSYCGRYDAPENLRVRKSVGPTCHAACASEYQQRRAHG